MGNSGAKLGFAAVLAMPGASTVEQQTIREMTEAELEQDLFGSSEIKRLPGRPPGAMNKRTKELRDLVNATGQNPVLFMATIYRDPSQTMELRLAAAREVARYTEQQMPQAIDLKAKGSGLILQIGLGATSGTPMVTGEGERLKTIEASSEEIIEQLQGVKVEATREVEQVELNGQ